MPIKPLSDRVLESLPSFDVPPLAADVAEHLGYPVSDVRKTFMALEEAGRAKIVRQARGLHLLPADSPVRPCPMCRREITGRGRTCSKSCGMRAAWTKRDRARQGDILRATRKREPQKFATFISLRDNPAHRQFVSDRNRKDWADPVKKMKRVIGMEAAWQGPAGEPRRAKARAKKLSLWSDPEWKAKTVEAMRTGKRGRFQRATIELVHEGAGPEEIAARTGRTLEQTRMLWRRLYRLGKVDRAPPDGRKRTCFS